MIKNDWSVNSIKQKLIQKKTTGNYEIKKLTFYLPFLRGKDGLSKMPMRNLHVLLILF